MKKRSLFTVVLLSCLCFNIQAQEVSVGIKGGLTIPNITPGGTKTPLSEGYSSRLAWGAGAFADIQFTKTFSLQLGLEYSGQGGKKDGMQAVPTGSVIDGLMGKIEQAGITLPPGMEEMLPGLFPQDKYLYADFKSVAKFNYLMLPVQAKFGWNLSPTSPFRVYVSAGVFGSYLLSAKRESTGVSPFYLAGGSQSISQYAQGVMTGMGVDPAIQGIVTGILDEIKTQDNDQTITNDIKDFNFGVIGAVGLSYRFCGRHQIFIEGGGNYGLVKIQKDKEHGQNRIGSGSVMLGYSFRL